MNILVISLIIFIIDQFVKSVVVTSLSTLSVIPGVLSFIFAKNKGVAFSMLYGKRLFIIIVSLILLFILLYIIKKDLKDGINKLKITSYGMILGGVLGNLFDRIIRGYVVDYIAVFSFPIFNIADICITVGVFLLVIEILFFENKKKE